MTTRICGECGKDKPIEDFAYNVKTKDYMKVCLPCTMYKKKHRKAVNYTETSKLQRHSKAGTL